MITTSRLVVLRAFRSSGRPTVPLEAGGRGCIRRCYGHLSRVAEVEQLNSTGTILVAGNPSASPKALQLLSPKSCTAHYPELRPTCGRECRVHKERPRAGMRPSHRALICGPLIKPTASPRRPSRKNSFCVLNPDISLLGFRDGLPSFIGVNEEGHIPKTDVGCRVWSLDALKSLSDPPSADLYLRSFKPAPQGRSGTVDVYGWLSKLWSLFWVP